MGIEVVASFTGVPHEGLDVERLARNVFENEVHLPPQSLLVSRPRLSRTRICEAEVSWYCSGHTFSRHSASYLQLRPCSVVCVQSSTTGSIGIRTTYRVPSWGNSTKKQALELPWLVWKTWPCCPSPCRDARLQTAYRLMDWKYASRNGVQPGDEAVDVGSEVGGEGSQSVAPGSG